MATTIRSASTANSLLQRLVTAALVAHVTADLTAIAWAVRFDTLLPTILFVVARIPLVLIGYWMLRTLERRAHSFGPPPRR